MARRRPAGSGHRDGRAGGGNVCDTATAWRRILSFYAEAGIIPAERAAAPLDDPDALAELVELPEIRALGRAQISAEQWAATSGEDADGCWWSAARTWGRCCPAAKASS
jgi:hypothetical protein